MKKQSNPLIDLQTLIEWANCRQWEPGDGQGVFGILAKRMTAATGKLVHRQQVQSWLHRDPDKRQMPSLETGLTLIEVGNKLMRE